ncbi:lanthionine synthetase LanC family protein [Streptomyces sp. TR06-5]|uniref:lanthionine synthetase LanC family protein n=1 Tax=Streptomyces sp. TR06-5 TaxID=3385976 RepID=UPI0039A01108
MRRPARSPAHRSTRSSPLHHVNRRRRRPRRCDRSPERHGPRRPAAEARAEAPGGRPGAGSAPAGISVDRATISRRHEPFRYGWCHGPAGDAHVFRELRNITGLPAWSALAERCWHTITHSGLPKRLRPGFWDNNGRCCGTAGGLALACDRIAEQQDPHDFAHELVSDIVARAIRSTEGTRWSNVEHRAGPSSLEPRHGWAMGNAGIIRELLRYVRLCRGGNPEYAFTWPDQPPVAGPGRDRASDAGTAS